MTGSWILTYFCSSVYSHSVRTFLYIDIVLYKSYRFQIGGDTLQLEQKDVQSTINLGGWQRWL